MLVLRITEFTLPNNKKSGYERKRKFPLIRKSIAMEGALQFATSDDLVAIADVIQRFLRLIL